MARETEKWMDDAECATIAPEPWFPDKGQSPANAKRICNTVCTVREQCLEYAVGNPSIQWGIWGGRSASELRALRKERGLADALELMDEDSTNGDEVVEE